MKALYFFLLICVLIYFSWIFHILVLKDLNIVNCLQSKIARRVKANPMIDRIKEKIKKFWSWLRKTILNKDMFLAFVIAELIFWLPCIIICVLAITLNSWWWTALTAIVLFWTAPFTPGWAIQIALAVFIKKLLDRARKKNPPT